MPSQTRPDVELCKRGEYRYERIIDAATETFNEKGLRRASLNEIVGRSGGSLSTLYRAFGNKEGLALAIIERHTTVIFERLRTLELAGLAPEVALHTFGDVVIDGILSRESFITHRIVFGEGNDYPALRDWFFEHGVMPTQALLAAYLQHEVDAGRLALASPQIASGQFFMMIFGELMMRISSGNIANPDRAVVLEEAHLAIDIFLRGALPAQTRERNA